MRCHVNNVMLPVDWYTTLLIVALVAALFVTAVLATIGVSDSRTPMSLLTPKHAQLYQLCQVFPVTPFRLVAPPYCRHAFRPLQSAPCA